MHFPRLRTVLGAGIVTVALAAPVVAWSALKGDEPPHVAPAAAPALRDTTMADAVQENARAADEAQRWHNLAVLHLRNVSDLLAAQEAQARARAPRSGSGGGGPGVCAGRNTGVPAQNPDSIPSYIVEAESGHTLDACNPSGACGKYQFMPGTWAGRGGYASACDAPEALQDQAAAELYAQRGCEPWVAC